MDGQIGKFGLRRQVHSIRQLEERPNAKIHSCSHSKDPTGTESSFSASEFVGTGELEYLIGVGEVEA